MDNMYNSITTVPATTKFNSNLNVLEAQPQSDVDVVGNDSELYAVLEKQLEVTHERGEEVTREVRHSAEQAVHDVREVVKLEAKVEKLEETRDRVVIGRQSPWGHVVYAEGKGAEEIRDSVDLAYREELDTLRDSKDALERKLDLQTAKIASLKNDVHIQSIKNEDAIYKLESSQTSLMEDKEVEVRAFKMDVERKATEDSLDNIREYRMQRDAVKRDFKALQNEFRAEKRELKLEYDALYLEINTIVKDAHESFLFKFSGLKKKFASFLNDLAAEKRFLPSWG